MLMRSESDRKTGETDGTEQPFDLTGATMSFLTPTGSGERDVTKAFLLQ